MDKHSHGGHEEHHEMGMRGVTRPMEEMRHHDGQQMNDEDRLHMLRMHHKQTLWVYWTVFLLGFWVLLSPLTFDYGKGVVEPSGGRDVWLEMGWRIAAMTWSDIITGLVLIVFGWRSLTPNRPVSLWICCFAGIWLSLAPLLLWSPSAVAYLNATFVGALLIALTVLIPGMPNMILFMRMGGDQPPGWSYNPSSWPQRWILIALAFGGWMTSRYLGAHQLGYIDHAWDPFFGEGTYRVLNSGMSHAWPVSDAALGSFAYTIEFLMGYMGATSRWRTMPWMVLFFGILVIPLGLVHIFLVISMPVAVGYWCSLCLLAAAFMLPMIPLSVDEVVAMGQHMLKSKRNGEPFWQVFWKGGSAAETTMDERSPELIGFPQKPGPVLKASLWGMSFPWTLVASTVLGLWLVSSPAVLGMEALAAHILHLGGALAVVVAVIAMGEPLRLARYGNVLLGLVIAGAPWIVAGAEMGAQLNASACGVALMLLSFSAGPKKESYGSWDRCVR